MLNTKAIYNKDKNNLNKTVESITKTDNDNYNSLTGKDDINIFKKTDTMNDGFMNIRDNGGLGPVGNGSVIMGGLGPVGNGSVITGGLGPVGNGSVITGGLGPVGNGSVIMGGLGPVVTGGLGPVGNKMQEKEGEVQETYVIWDNENNVFKIYEYNSLYGIISYEDIIYVILNPSHENKLINRYFFTMMYNREKELYEIVFLKTIFTEDIDVMNKMHNYIYDLVNNSTCNDDNINNLTMFYFQLALFLFKTIIPSIPTDTTNIVKISKITSVINYKFSTLVLKNILLISEENNANSNLLRQLVAREQSIGGAVEKEEHVIVVVNKKEGLMDGVVEERINGDRKVEERMNGDRKVEERMNGDRKVEERMNGVVEERINGVVEERINGDRKVEERINGVVEESDNEFLIFRKNSNINLDNSINSSLNNSNNNKYIELDASENQILNISDINNISNVEEIKNKRGGNKKKAVIKGSRKISIEPSYNKDSILNNSKIYKLTKL
jgi:hypothetical protein